MWKSNASVVPSSQSITPTTHEQPRPVITAVSENSPSSPAAISIHDQAMIGRGIVLKGDISGRGPIYIEGTVEGNINLPGERVTVGINGRVAASMMSSSTPCIAARELVIMGQVLGNVSATDRVDIRTDGSLTGDITTARVSIADGAFFKGGIDIRRPEKTLSISSKGETASIRPDVSEETA